MRAPEAIDVLPEHHRLVRAILRAHLPPKSRVWVFGSRATGRGRRYSDLDLAIDAGRCLTIDETAILREAFDDSDLPYGVDIVDWHAISGGFHRLIANERIALPVPHDR